MVEVQLAYHVGGQFVNMVASLDKPPQNDVRRDPVQGAGIVQPHAASKGAEDLDHLLQGSLEAVEDGAPGHHQRLARATAVAVKLDCACGNRS